MTRLLAALCLALLLGGCATPPAAGPEPGPDRLLVVAIADALPEVLPGAGSTPRASYRRSAGYAGSSEATGNAAALAREHALDQRRAWTIQPLGLRCMLYAIAPGADRDAVIARLQRDPRVALVQPLNAFETLASAYNDPYVGLQRGFAAINAEAAQRVSRGEGVRIAVIDSAVDAAHPDLPGRVARQQDFVGSADPAAGERHGTQVAGVIAAAVNNGRGIVGVAPAAQLLAFRACWGVAGSAASRCDSYTLALALANAITAEADVINMSLGGPADPLLQRLAEHAMRRGAIMVAALPASGRAEGFPAGVPGVLTVGAAGLPAAPGVLTAPGREILTLQPGGGYDYASGSSLASAHVAGVVALLRALAPRLDGGAVRALLGDAPVDACAALRRLRAGADCTAVTLQ